MNQILINVFEEEYNNIIFISILRYSNFWNIQNALPPQKNVPLVKYSNNILLKSSRMHNQGVLSFASALES